MNHTQSPLKLSVTYSVLMALLALTYFAAHWDLGRFGLPVALFIAGLKAGFVLLFFMELRHASGIHRVTAGVGVFWLGILMVLSFSDYLTRGWLLLPGPWPQ